MERSKGNNQDIEKLINLVINCAYRVRGELAFGYVEEIYKRALQIELENLGILSMREAPLNVKYRGIPIGIYYADFLIENRLIVEAKAVSNLVVAHEIQLVNYLTTSDVDYGLLINFGPDGIEVKRKVRDLGHYYSTHPKKPFI